VVDVVITGIGALSQSSFNVESLAVKFLVDHNGKPFKRYGNRTPPFDLKDDIEELLEKKES